MKPFKEVINYLAGNSFVIKYNDFEHFSVPYHYHNEFELAYILRSTGKKFVGDVIEDFGPGDLVFLGSTLPHFFLNDKQYYSGNKELRVNAYILQFPADYFSDNQLIRPEFASISRLLANSSRVARIEIPGKYKNPGCRINSENVSGQWTDSIFHTH